MEVTTPILGLLSTVAIIVTLYYMNGGLQRRVGIGKNITDPNGPEVQFVLFRRDTDPRKLIVDDYELKEANFNKSAPTKIIIHGYLSGIDQDVFLLNKEAFLIMEDLNIIGMDWSALCKSEYLSAIHGANIAAQYLTKMLEWLIGKGVSLQKIHLIGHSLGAHIAGMAASNIKKGKVSRITGLDPALPGYRNKDLKGKLDATDAELVDVIHTYMQILGYGVPLGHVDFYANGGRFQPGCPNIYNIWNIGESLVCNHARSYQLFAESILNPKAFKCKRCNSVIEALAENCSEESDIYVGQSETYRNGLYYFSTRGTYPFSPMGEVQ